VAGVERVPDDLVLGPDEAVAEAQRLLDAGLPFPAHDVLEGVWKTAPAAERALWRGLAQLAVGLTHALRGNDSGAPALLRRGSDIDGLCGHEQTSSRWLRWVQRSTGFSVNDRPRGPSG